MFINLIFTPHTPDYASRDTAQVFTRCRKIFFTLRINSLCL